MRGNVERGRLGKPPELRVTDLNRSPNDSTEDPWNWDSHLTQIWHKPRPSDVSQTSGGQLRARGTNQRQGYLEEELGKERLTKPMRQRTEGPGVGFSTLASHGSNSTDYSPIEFEREPGMATRAANDDGPEVRNTKFSAARNEMRQQTPRAQTTSVRDLREPGRQDVQDTGMASTTTRQRPNLAMDLGGPHPSLTEETLEEWEQEDVRPPLANFELADEQYWIGRAPYKDRDPNLEGISEDLDRLERVGMGELLSKSDVRVKYNPVAKKNMLGWINPEYRRWYWIPLVPDLCVQCGIELVPGTMIVNVNGKAMRHLTDTSRNQCRNCTKLLKEKLIRRREPVPTESTSSTGLSDVTTVIEEEAGQGRDGGREGFNQGMTMRQWDSGHGTARPTAFKKDQQWESGSQTGSVRDLREGEPPSKRKIAPTPVPTLYEDAKPRAHTQRRGSSRARDEPEEEEGEAETEVQLRVHQKLPSEALNRAFRVRHLSYLVEPVEKKEYTKMIGAVGQRATELAEEMRAVFRGERDDFDDEGDMVTQLREHLDKVATSTVASTQWKRAAEEFAEAQLDNFQAMLAAEGTVMGEVGGKLADIRAEVARYSVLCERLEELREDSRIIKAAIKMLGQGYKELVEWKGYDPKAEQWSTDDDDGDDQYSRMTEDSRGLPIKRSAATEVRTQERTRGSNQQTKTRGSHARGGGDSGSIGSVEKLQGQEGVKRTSAKTRLPVVDEEGYISPPKRASVRVKRESTGTVGGSDSEGRYDSLQEEEDEDVEDTQAGAGGGDTEGTDDGEEGESSTTEEEEAAKTTPKQKRGSRGQSSRVTSPEPQTPPPSIRKLIRDSPAIDHRSFCKMLRATKAIVKLETSMKGTRTKAINQQMKISRDKKALFEQMPVFSILPTERRTQGEKFRTLSEVSMGREGNLITHLLQWVRVAEQSNMNRKEFFAVLVEGGTLGGVLKQRYETWTNNAAFTNERPETIVNDVLHWGTKIIRWMVQLIAMAGKVPDMNELEIKIEALKIDRSTWEKVDEAWMEFRSYFRDLPEGQRTVTAQYGRWKSKMLSGASLYGKKWIAKMSEHLEALEDQEWTEEQLEAAFRKAASFAQKAECSWIPDKPLEKGRKSHSVATYAEVTARPAVSGDELSDEPRMSEKDEVKFCQRCYGSHYVASTRPNQCCFYRQEKDKYGKYPNAPYTIGYNLGEEMWFLGRSDLTAKFWAALQKDEDLQAMTNYDRTRFEDRLRELITMLTERTRAREQSGRGRGRGGGRGRGRGRGGGAPAGPSGAPASQSTASTITSATGSDRTNIEGAMKQAHSSAQAIGTEADAGKRYVVASFPKAINPEDVREVGEDLTFATSDLSAVNQCGGTTILPVGLDPMSAVTTVSRALVRRMGWTEEELPHDQWIDMVTGLEGGGVAILKSVVRIQHRFTDAEGVREIRVVATHHVVEKPNFDILIGKASLKDWEANLSFSRRKREEMVIDGLLRVPTYGVQEAIKVVSRRCDERTRNSVIWRNLGVTVKCAAAFQAKEYDNIGLCVAPGGGWQALRFKGSNEVPGGLPVLVRIVKDQTPKWRHIDGSIQSCLDFARVSSCKGRVEVYVRSKVTYPVEISKGEVRVKVIPYIAGETVIDTEEYMPTQDTEQRRRVRFSVATMGETITKLAHPPPVYPKEAAFLWEATRIEAKAALYAWTEAEGADPALQARQLREIMDGLDIYDSRIAVDRAPWQSEGDVLRVPEEYRRRASDSIRLVASELGGREAEEAKTTELSAEFSADSRSRSTSPESMSAEEAL